MNPYDEPTSRARRTRLSWDDSDDQPGRFDDLGRPPEGDPPTASGRASVGRPPVSGSAPRGPRYLDQGHHDQGHRDQGHRDQGHRADRYPSPHDSYEPYPGGRDPYPPDPPPVSPVGPVVGRAAVRPVSPSGPGPGAGGPGGGGRGPRGPSGGGPGGRFPFGGGDDEGGDEPGRRRPGASDPRRARKARRRNIIIAGFAVFIMLAGVGVVGGTYYVDSIKTPDQLPLPETTTVYYSDGTTIMAKLSAQTRYELKYPEMNDAVRQTIVAAEDQTFWTNPGVDFKGVMRAAWNNFTGGQTQGASTITQQYARLAFDLSGATYSRKLREAVMAWKLDDSLSKEQILEYYLNTVPFGRSSSGVEAAAQAFFGKTANRSAPAAQQITVPEAMVLMAMVKQPEADPHDPANSPGYDPTRGAKALANSKDRWEYIRASMVKLGYLTPEAAATLKYPEGAVKPYNPKTAGTGLDKPTGLVVQHALSELATSDVFKDKGWSYIRDGGFKIVTTVDARAQKAAEAAADITASTAPSAVRGQPANWQAALVAVEPGTGRVLAYFGGKDGTGSDYAGWYYDDKGEANGFGAHPPGSTFKVYDLATALKRGYSVMSYWDSPAVKEFPEAGRVKGQLGPIRNASSAKCQPSCTLVDAAVASLNVPFFDLTLHLGAANVLETARDAGVDYMWDGKAARRQLAGANIPQDMVPERFGNELGIGQYGITVLDHANGMATMAAGGRRSQAHFVKSVTKKGKPVYGETIRNTSIGLNPSQVDDLDYTLSKVSTGRFSSQWDSTGKTGTWQWGNSTTKNSDVWMVGYTKAIAAAAWVGTKDGGPLITKSKAVNVYGYNYPGPIWQQFMLQAHKDMKLDPNKYRFGPFANTGNLDPDGSIPSPTPTDVLPPTFDPFFCQQQPQLCPSPFPTVPTTGPSGGGNGRRHPPTPSKSP